MVNYELVDTFILQKLLLYILLV